MLTRWTPVAPMRTFERFNRMMEEMLGDSNGEFRSGWLPSVDVKETDGELAFAVELPGMNEKDIKVDLVGDLLTIRGEREFSKEEKKEDYVRIERSYGSFQRSFTLDVPVKADQIDAKYKDGVLTVTLPKAESIAPKRIEVQKG